MKPRVLIFRADLLPMSETFIAAQARALRRYEPRFFGLRRSKPCLPLPAAPICGAGISAAERLLYRTTGVAPSLVQAGRREQAALLHAHFAINGAEVLPLRRSLGLPLLVTLHGYDVMCDDQAHRLTRRGRAYLDRREQLWEETALFLCVSEALRKQALARGFPAHKLCVLPLGVDTEQLSFKPVLPAAPSVLFVGRLVPKKGCHLLIQAMERVQAKLPDGRLLIVGDGPERERLERTAADRTTGTQFLGRLTAEEVREQMRGARCLTAPSITAENGDAEGLPTVLCEALALGLPVASTVHSGIPELVEHGRSGLLSAEGDVEALAAHILTVCTDDALAERLRHAGRRRIEASYDLHRQTRLLEDVYDEVAGLHPPAAGVPFAPRPTITSTCEAESQQTISVPRSSRNAVRTHQAWPAPLHSPA